LNSLPLVHELKLPLFYPWSPADGGVDNGYAPNYGFRLSFRDSWAMPTMLRHATKSGAKQVGLLLVNTDWGRRRCLA